MRKDPLELLGATIRKLRKARGLTQEELAEKADIHVNYLAGVERGHRNVSTLNLCWIARGLGIHVRDLFQDFSDADIRSLPRKSSARLRREQEK